MQWFHSEEANDTKLWKKSVNLSTVVDEQQRKCGVSTRSVTSKTVLFVSKMSSTIIIQSHCYYLMHLSSGDKPCIRALLLPSSQGRNQACHSCPECSICPTLPYNVNESAHLMGVYLRCCWRRDLWCLLLNWSAYSWTYCHLAMPTG
jgi:hypothetical protein